MGERGVMAMYRSYAGVPPPSPVRAEMVEEDRSRIEIERDRGRDRRDGKGKATGLNSSRLIVYRLLSDTRPVMGMAVLPSPHVYDVW